MVKLGILLQSRKTQLGQDIYQVVMENSKTKKYLNNKTISKQFL